MLDKVLLTGGSGLLGKELQKYITCVAPSHKEMDIADMNSLISYDPDVVIHCAAYTDVAKAEKEKEECFKTNVTGTYNLATVFKYRYFIYISSEYAVNPINYYSQTKQMGEEIVRSICPSHLIIRTLFKPNPFPYKYAFFDQFTNGDYVDVIAPMIASEIMKRSTGIINIGTGKKSIFELARRTKPHIKAISVDDVKDVKIPKEASYYG